jgi:DNA polymerase III delta prime subunit
MRATVENASTNGTLAILFTGPSGSGKTTLALAVARELNADDFHGTHIIESRGCTLERLKEASENAAILPPNGGWKTYILDEAHEVTKGGQGYLLGMLERLPPRRAIIATSTQQQPFDDPALLSRFLHIKLPQPEPAPAAARVEEIARLEGIEPPPTVTILDILKRNRGNLRTTINEVVMIGARI